MDFPLALSDMLLDIYGFIPILTVNVRYLRCAALKGNGTLVLNSLSNILKLESSPGFILQTEEKQHAG